MKTFLGMLSGLVLSLSATVASATVIPSDYGFTGPGTVLLNDMDGLVDFIGPQDLIIIEADGGDFYAEVFPSALGDGLLDWLALPEIYDSTNSTIYASVMMQEIDMFFDLDAIGYLVEAEIFNLSSDLTNEGLEFVEDATVVVTEFTKTTLAPIPLPAGFPLILAGLGSLAFVRMRARG